MQQQKALSGPNRTPVRAEEILPPDLYLACILQVPLLEALRLQRDMLSWPFRAHHHPASPSSTPNSQTGGAVAVLSPGGPVGVVRATSEAAEP